MGQTVVVSYTHDAAKINLVMPAGLVVRRRISAVPSWRNARKMAEALAIDQHCLLSFDANFLVEHRLPHPREALLLRPGASLATVRSPGIPNNANGIADSVSPRLGTEAAIVCIDSTTSNCFS